MLYTIKHFFSKLKRIIDWVPIIWNSCDFDFIDSIDVFKYQLKRTANFLESDKANTVNAKRHAKQIRTAIRLMENVYDDKYGMEYLTVLENKYGKSKIDFKPIKINDKEYHELYVNWEKEYNDEELEFINQETRDLMIASDKKQEKAHRLLWSYIEHHIREWWD